MEWFWPEGFYTIVMVGVFAAAAFTLKQPIAVALAIAAIVGALVSGNGVPVDHLIEGAFGYLDTILIIFAAMVFMKTVQHIGLMESVAAWMIRRFRELPFRLTMGITGLLMLHGMITGSSSPAARIASKEPRCAPSRIAPRFSRVSAERCSSPSRLKRKRSSSPRAK